MDQHSLKQTDLAAEIGGQSVVSDILNGKREINARTDVAVLAIGQQWRSFERLD